MQRDSAGDQGLSGTQNFDCIARERAGQRPGNNRCVTTCRLRAGFSADSKCRVGRHRRGCSAPLGHCRCLHGLARRKRVAKGKPRRSCCRIGWKTLHAQFHAAVLAHFGIRTTYAPLAPVQEPGLSISLGGQAFGRYAFFGQIAADRLGALLRQAQVVRRTTARIGMGANLYGRRRSCFQQQGYMVQISDGFRGQRRFVGSKLNPGQDHAKFFGTGRLLRNNTKAGKPWNKKEVSHRWGKDAKRPEVVPTFAPYAYRIYGHARLCRAVFGNFAGQRL